MVCACTCWYSLVFCLGFLYLVVCHSFFIGHISYIHTKVVRDLLAKSHNCHLCNFKFLVIGVSELSSVKNPVYIGAGVSSWFPFFTQHLHIVSVIMILEIYSILLFSEFVS